MRGYGCFTMTSPIQLGQSALSSEADLRAELARCEAVRRTISPILVHLLGNGANSLYSDDILAAIRGMAHDVSRQLLEAIDATDSDAESHLPDILLKKKDFIDHLHALALEWKMTQRLHTRLALDPVLSPLLQDLIASTDPETSGLAMHVLAAQARFCQAQRRMNLPIGELPAFILPEIFSSIHLALGKQSDGQVAAVEGWLRVRCDYSKSRLDLMSRLMTSMGGQISMALSVSNAGVALFAVALSIVLQQHKDLVMLSLNDSQAVRLALSLRAAGLKQQDVGAQIFSLHPDMPLSLDLDQISPDEAAAILTTAPQAEAS